MRKGVGNIRAAVQVVDVQRADLFDAALDQFADGRNGEDFIGLGPEISPVFGVDDVVREDLALQVFRGHGQALDLGLFQFADMGARVMRRPSLDDDLLADADLERRGSRRGRRCGMTSNSISFLDRWNTFFSKKHVQHLFLGIAEGAQDDGHRQLAAPVDAARNTQSFGSNSKSSHEPRYGMMRGGEQQLAR